mmetsp:Transcript_58657/g.174583  ORF Transcript_58657/g.174583 Transcript_58657/m.174583 type:complete len:201 (+) Transcript_58657:724-1326(+)
MVRRDEGVGRGGIPPRHALRTPVRGAREGSAGRTRGGRDRTGREHKQKTKERRRRRRRRSNGVLRPRQALGGWGGGGRPTLWNTLRPPNASGPSRRIPPPSHTPLLPRGPRSPLRRTIQASRTSPVRRDGRRDRPPPYHRPIAPGGIVPPRSGVDGEELGGSDRPRIGLLSMGGFGRGSLLDTHDRGGTGGFRGDIGERR